MLLCAGACQYRYFWEKSRQSNIGLFQIYAMLRASTMNFAVAKGPITTRSYLYECTPAPVPDRQRPRYCTAPPRRSHAWHCVAGGLLLGHAGQQSPMAGSVGIGTRRGLPSARLFRPWRIRRRIPRWHDLVMAGAKPCQYSGSFPPDRRFSSVRPWADGSPCE